MLNRADDCLADEDETTQLMAGRVHALIQELMALRGSSASTAHFVRAHLALSGIDVTAYDERSPDDEAKVLLLQKMLSEYRSKFAPPETFRKHE
jgi:hypothetical protein